MLPLLLLTVTAVYAAPLSADQKPPFLPRVFQNHSFFHDDASAAAAVERFHASVGVPGALDQLMSIRLDHNARPHGDVLPDNILRPYPTITDINAPIAKFLYGGDVMLSPEDANRMRANNIRNKRGAPVVTSKRWLKTQPIAFIFNNDIDEPTRQNIRKATQKIAENTCLSFQENGAGTQLQFHRGGGCWSYIGNKMTGKQPISIDKGCTNVKIISHEISHALGIDHTQTRKDRDTYVTINVGAVAEEDTHNFDKHTDAENNNFGVPYDYGSAMHYGRYHLSANGQAVIVPTQAGYENTIGQERTVTFNDYKLINALYECSANCPKQMACQNGGYTSPKNCNACVCNDFYTGTNCETPRTTITLTGTAETAFNQAYNATLYASGNNQNWDMFGKDAVKIIRAPEGKKIKVTINQINAANGQLGCYEGCPFVGLEFVDNAAADLTLAGKLYCCKKDENFSFTSKSNVIGYKAYASPGMPFDGTVTYTVV